MREFSGMVLDGVAILEARLWLMLKISKESIWQERPGGGISIFYTQPFDVWRYVKGFTLQFISTIYPGLFLNYSL